MLRAARTRPRTTARPSVRAMGWEDMPEVERLAAAAFGFEIDGSETASRWRARLTHLLSTDPEGAFVAEHEGRVVGAAQVALRERLWCLSLLTVDPGAQSHGAGSALMERALRHRGQTEAGLIASSNDPRALRLYARSGFSLRPALEATGVAHRPSIPRRDPAIRAGTADDLAGLADVSREVRGGPHTTELQYALDRGYELLVIDERGFAVAREGQGVWLLAARDDAGAAALLWAGLDVSGDAERPLRWITAEQDWAVRVAVGAGLGLRANGALAVSGKPGPLRPFLPSASFS